MKKCEMGEVGVDLQELGGRTEGEENESLFDEGPENPFAAAGGKGGNEFVREAIQLAQLPTGRRWCTLAARLLWVAGPLFCLQIFSYFCIVTDVVVVGRWVGVTAMAAMGLSGAFQNSVAFIAYNISTLGLFTIISQSHGREDVVTKGLALQTALVVGLLLCVPVGVMLFFTAEILALAGNVTDPELLRLLSLSGKLSIPGVVFECSYRVIEAALVNQRFLAPCVVVQFATLLLNAAFNALFVLGLRWGFAGSVIGTSLMRLVRLVAVVAVFFGSRSIRESAWTPWSRRAVSPAVLWLFLKHSVPSGMAVTLEIASFECVSFLAASFGVLASSVHVAMFQVVVTAFFFIFGVTNALTVIVGNFLGANELATALSFARVGGVLAIAIAAVDAVLILSLRSYIPRLFTTDANVLAGAVALLPLVVAVNLPDTCNQIVASLLRAAGRSLGSTVAVLSGTILVGWPCCWWFGFHLEMGLRGLWIGLACGTGAVLLVQLVFLSRIDWKSVAKEASSESLAH